jgi:hypothetical protein
VRADENLKPEVEVSDNSLDISLNKVGDNIKILKNEKLIKETKPDKTILNNNKEKIVLNSLDSDTPHRYKVKAYEEGKLIDEAIIETTTKRSDKDKKEIKNNPLKDSNLITIIKKNEVTLQWSGIPDTDNTFEIYRGGKLIETVKGETYVDSKIKPNQKYQYEIVGKTKISDEEIKAKKEKLKEYKIPLNKKEEENLIYITNKVIKNVNTFNNKTTPSKSSISTNSLLSPNGRGFVLRYQTFIPDPKVWNPSASSRKWPKFKGDNRSKYDWFSNAYRTRTDVYCLFNYTTPKAIFQKKVNVTVGFDWSGKPAKKKFADLSKVKLDFQTTGNDSGGKYLKFQVSHAAADPLVEPISLAPNIDYTYNAKVYENGSISALGSHDKAPSHELWIINYPGDFAGPLHTSWNKGFKYLIPIYSQENWSYVQ